MLYLLLKCLILFPFTLCPFVSASTSSFSLAYDYFASSSFDAFTFQTEPDPTNGYVNYISQSDAVSQGLAKVVNGNQMYIGADGTNVASDPGRNSTRLESKYNFTNGLLVADIAHMPGGACGIWPALWTFNFAADPYGEIDIIEGDMHHDTYAVSLHTCGACSFTSSLPSNSTRTDCNLGGDISGGCPDDKITNGDGCGLTSPSDTFGSAWNEKGGGVFAALIAPAGVKIWSWFNGSVPADVVSGQPDPTRDEWKGGLFVDLVGGSGCDVGHYFKEQSVIINVDFCGDEIDDSEWNGDAQCSGAGAGTGSKGCKAFVRDHPEAFGEAYWLFNSLRLYQTS